MKNFEHNIAWKNLAIPLYSENEIFELYHENSKITEHTQFPPSQMVIEKMSKMYESLSYDQFPEKKLKPPLKNFKKSLSSSILSRKSPINISSDQFKNVVNSDGKKTHKVDSIKFKDLSTILYYAYGINRKNEDNDFPRPFRVVPSGGALYPLEIYFYANNIKNLEPGLYHYNPTKSSIFKIPHDNSISLEKLFVDFQSDLGKKSSMIMFLTAVFERSAMKYMARSYRFILIETGHVAQNINLVTTALGRSILNVGGFYDRKVDKFLNLDGISHSTLYLQSII